MYFPFRLPFVLIALSKQREKILIYFFLFFFASGGGLPLSPEGLCLSSEFSTVRDAGFEPRTNDSVVWSPTNEPPHLRRRILKYSQSCLTVLLTERCP